MPTTVIQDTKMSVGEFTREFTIPAEAPGDTDRRLVIKYDAIVHFYMKQTGSASKGLHVIDTRKCHKWAKAWISRQIYFELETGALVELGGPVTMDGPPSPAPNMPSIKDLVNILYKDRSIYALGEAISFGAFHHTCGKVKDSFIDRQPAIILNIKAYLAKYDGESPEGFESQESLIREINHVAPGAFTDKQLDRMVEVTKAISFGPDED